MERSNGECELLHTGGKKVSVLFLLILMLCGFTACGKEEKEIVEITLIHGWGSTEPDHVAMRQIYQDFEKEHPYIKINLLSMPSADDVLTKVEDMLAVGEIPDIVFTAGTGRDTIYEFMIENNYAVDLMPYIEADSLFKSNVSDSILSYWTDEENHLYTVSDVLLLASYWYNEEIFVAAGIRELPSTWPEFIQVCEQIQSWADTHGKKVVPIVLDTEHILYLTNAMLADINPDMLKKIEENQIDIRSGEFTQMLIWMKELYQYSDLMENYTYRDTLHSFNAQETAIYINGVWANTMIDEKLKVSYAAFPNREGTGTTNISSCVGYIVGESKDQRKVEASVEFIKYMLSEPVANLILTRTGQIPSNPKVEIKDTTENNRLYQAVSCVRNAAVIMETPDNIWDLALKTVYGESVKLYLTDQISLDEFSRRLKVKEKVNKINF